MAAYTTWREWRTDAIENGCRPSIRIQTVTAKNGAAPVHPAAIAAVEVVQIARQPERPSGRRFGALVHAVLASVPLDPDASAIRDLANVHGRILGATPEEIAAAAAAVRDALAHSLFREVRAA